MLDVNAMMEATIGSLQLSSENRNEDALRILNEWIDRAELESEIEWVFILCGMASNLADQMDDIRLANLYNGKMLSSTSKSICGRAMAHYNLAKAMFRHGEIASAKQHAARSYALIADATHETELIVLERVLKAWPEVKNWKPRDD